ncbi:MAG: SDR family oxidoreductase [Acetobacter sp.]
MTLTNKVALVTGAAQGIGLACAERLVADGAKVLMVDRDAAFLTTQTAHLGEKVACLAADLGAIDRDGAQSIVQAALTAFGRLDILVNNAGIMHLDDFVAYPETAFDAVMRVNVKAPFLLGQAAARAMIAQGEGGCVINMSSTNAILVNPASTAYEVSKGAIRQLTAVMAADLIRYGIRVNAIGPGTILTDMVKKSLMMNADQQDMILSRTPIGRCGDPAEVASVASFLASDDASYIVGQTIYVDGGRLILNYTTANT